MRHSKRSTSMRRGPEDVIRGQPVVQEGLEGIQADLRGVSRPGDQRAVALEIREAARVGGARLARLVIAAPDA
jgi:hypothetical protein